MGNTDSRFKEGKTDSLADMTPIMTEIYDLAKEYSFDQIGFAKLTRPLTMDFYDTWIRQGYHAQMAYLANHQEMKASPQKLRPLAKTALVVTQNYYPHPRSASPFPSPLRVASYAQGEDYHLWFKQKLKDLAERLHQKYPNLEFVPFTDSAPVLERDLASRAGLGWFGKNTCLIDRGQGSLFFIGEIYTSLEMSPAQKPEALGLDFCGKCQRCIEICPTQALQPGRTLIAERCISYLTIESKTNPPPEIRSQIGDWFFGCDLCQTVCPWNQKKYNNTLITEVTRSYTADEIRQLTQELRKILSSSGKQLLKYYSGTPLVRAGPKGLRRNAILVAGNLRLAELKKTIEAHQSCPELLELCLWYLQQLKTD